ncbi:ubiquitin thioesterase OTU1-like protein [Gorgonomyces haynaldii]|nr:ubiquitin thioesterase OTU1-like protein [Gorgonomyces haynaldii]
MEQGTLCVRVMKDDNSCLFRSISYLMTKDPEQHADYRQLVANVIMSDPDRYNAVFLGRSNQEYCQWILNPKSWGGAIEISIFSEQLQMEIISLDVSTGRMDRFGEGTYKSSAFVMYSGIHYDAIVLTPHLGASKDFDQTVFEDAEVLIPAVSSLGALWKKKHKYTDVANFTLKCGVCGIGLQGQSAAQKHCQQTGHAQFTEYQ